MGNREGSSPSPDRLSLGNSAIYDESQDNFVEAHDPAELIMCIILAAAYAGLAKLLFNPLLEAGNWRLLVNIEGFFCIVALLALVIGIRPYISPCSLQLSSKGLKYRGPYWPQRKTVNWERIFRIYLAPEMILILYYPGKERKGIRPLLIQSVYLSDKDKIEDAVIKYSPAPPILLSNPGWMTRLIFIVCFVLLMIAILEWLLSGVHV